MKVIPCPWPPTARTTKDKAGSMVSTGHQGEFYGLWMFLVQISN
jgi:hypothetical protein